MDMSCRKQSLSLGKSKSFVSCIKFRNPELYTYCTQDNRLFKDGYTQLLARLEKAKYGLLQLEFDGVYIEYPSQIAIKFGYESISSLARSAEEQINKYNSEDSHVNKLLHFTQVLEEVLRVNKVMALTPNI